MKKNIIALLFVLLSGLCFAQDHIVSPANGGTGVANTATETLGSSNINWATLGTGIVINTTTTGAKSVIAPSGMKCYPFQGSGGTGCDTPSGGGGGGSSNYPYPLLSVVLCNDPIGSTNPCSVTLGTGHLIVACYSGGSSGITITDNLSDTYHFDGSDNNYSELWCWNLPNNPPGITTITTAQTPTVAGAWMLVLEFQDMALSSALDLATAQDYAPCTPPAVQAPITTTHIHDLIVELITTSISTTTYLAGPGFYMPISGNGGNAISAIGVEYAPVWSVGTYTPLVYCSANSQESLTLAYKFQ